MMNDGQTLFDEGSTSHFGMSLKSIRVARLNKLAGSMGPVEFGRKIGRSPSQASDLLTGRAPSFGEKLARSIEDQLGLPPLWLDQDEGNVPADVERALTQEEADELLTALTAIADFVSKLDHVAREAVKRWLTLLVDEPQNVGTIRHYMGDLHRRASEAPLPSDDSASGPKRLVLSTGGYRVNEQRGGHTATRRRKQ